MSARQGVQPFNHTTKAIEALRNYPCPGAPGTRQGMDYLIDKMRKAEVFILPDCGELLERHKPRAGIPGLALKPPFEVVALEYTATGRQLGDSEYTAAPCSRRIALAWEWCDDLPPILASIAQPIEGQGVVIASVSYYDNQSLWLPVMGAAFLPYESETSPVVNLCNEQYLSAMLREGRIKPSAVAHGTVADMIPILPEAIGMGAYQRGSDFVFNSIAADLMDEVSAYRDLCHILMCKNVRAERQTVSSALNAARNKRRKPPLKDFHILTIDGHDGEGGGFSADRNGPRSHLRRGHIRRIANDRVTWVNATMVHGHGGFVDKQYSIGGKS